MNEINIVLVDVTTGFRGCAVPEPDGNYTVYLNARYTVEERQKIFAHEVEHLIQGHHYDERSLSVIEAEASRTIDFEKIKDAERNGLSLPRKKPALTVVARSGPEYGSQEYYQQQLNQLRRNSMLGML